MQRSISRRRIHTAEEKAAEDRWISVSSTVGQYDRIWGSACCIDLLQIASTWNRRAQPLSCHGKTAIGGASLGAANTLLHAQFSISWLSILLTTGKLYVYDIFQSNFFHTLHISLCHFCRTNYNSYKMYIRLVSFDEQVTNYYNNN